MKTTVIHHSADFDGLFCREIARKFLPDAELIGWDFKDEPLPIPPEGIIYVMDLPVDRVFGTTVLAVDNSELCFLTNTPPPRRIPLHRIIWIDHHKSSIETHPDAIPGYRIDGVAACRLAWQWFTHPQIISAPMSEWKLPPKNYFLERKVEEPLAVRLAGEYDIWDKRDPDAELFQHGLRSEELYSTAWDDMLDVDGGGTVVRLLNQGRALQFARAQEYRDVITQQGFDVVFEGVRFLACNSHELDIRSHLFEAGIKTTHEALLGFTYNGVSKDWRVSMYHAPGHEHHDLSLIAQKHGGGGHRGACGFRTKKLPFLP